MAPLALRKNQVNSLFNVLKIPFCIASKPSVRGGIRCFVAEAQVPARSAVFTETYRAGLDLLERHRLSAAERFERCVAPTRL